MSFDDEGKIVISDKMSDINLVLMNVDRNRSITMTEKTKLYMEYHRNKLK